MTEAISELRTLRRTLHRHPELSGREQSTAGAICDFLTRCQPDQLHTNLGGHGLAAEFHGLADGPSLLVRSELDALPIPDAISADHVSASEGIGHKCGHDGHMVMVAGLASLLKQNPPARGRVILLFQPAEETGQGAREMLEDPRFSAVRPDAVIALHNLPGFPLGDIIVRDGVFASASKGLIFRLTGATAHAAEPERGRSPALAVAHLISALSAAPQFFTRLHEAAKVTVIHSRIGEVAFGTSPGEGVVMATLRAHDQTVMDSLAQKCTDLAEGIARAHELSCVFEWVEEFPSTVNDPDLVEAVRTAARSLGLNVRDVDTPFAWSEDFGNFTARTPGVLFGLGTGENHPALHHPSYDFPDDLIPIGLTLFARIIGDRLGGLGQGDIRQH